MGLSDFFWGDWRTDNPRTFTIEQVEGLLERVKEFNAGVIDKYLTEHVDKVFKEWLADN